MNTVGISGINKYFDPLPDITTLELAYCTLLLVKAAAGAPGHDLRADYERLPDNIKRHFRDRNE